MNFSETFTFYFLLLLLSDITLKITLNILTSIQILFHSIFFGVCLSHLPHPLPVAYSSVFAFVAYLVSWVFLWLFWENWKYVNSLGSYLFITETFRAFSQINLQKFCCWMENALQLYLTRQSNSSISIFMVVLILVWNVSWRIWVMYKFISLLLRW